MVDGNRLGTTTLPALLILVYIYTSKMCSETEFDGVRARNLTTDFQLRRGHIYERAWTSGLRHP